MLIRRNKTKWWGDCKNLREQPIQTHFKIRKLRTQRGKRLVRSQNDVPWFQVLCSFAQSDCALLIKWTHTWKHATSEVPSTVPDKAGNGLAKKRLHRPDSSRHHGLLTSHVLRLRLDCICKDPIFPIRSQPQDTGGNELEGGGGALLNSVHTPSKHSINTIYWNFDYCQILTANLGDGCYLHWATQGNLRVK